MYIIGKSVYNIFSQPIDRQMIQNIQFLVPKSTEKILNPPKQDSMRIQTPVLQKPVFVKINLYKRGSITSDISEKKALSNYSSEHQSEFLLKDQLMSLIN